MFHVILFYYPHCVTYIFILGSSAQLQIASLPPNQSTKYSLPLSFNNAVQKMEPLDTLQVAVKNNIKVFYFATTIPIEVNEIHFFFCN